MFAVFNLVTAATRAAVAPVLVLLVCATCSAQQLPYSWSDDRIRPFVEANDFMGVIAVQAAGQETVVQSYGLADVELEVPHDPNGIFLIGSISKQFTAAAILRLEQQGHLDTDDPVSLHLPGFKPDSGITLHQLMNHTSGVADIFSLPAFGATGGLHGEFESVIADLNSAPLTGEPGRGYAYSNGGYAVLAAVIESVSGMGYGEFLDTAFFQPLGLEHTRHDAAGPAVSHRVTGYDPWSSSSLTPAVPMAPAYSAGSGSLWSSAQDLLDWTLALHNGQVLDAASYIKLTTDYGYRYGYGLSVFSRFDRDVIGHDGRVPGFAADVAWYRDDNLAVVILNNVQSVSKDQVRVLVAAEVLGVSVQNSVPPALAQDALPDLHPLLGNYSFGPGFVVAISEQDGRLLARANEGGYSELLPTQNGRWFSRMLYQTVNFEQIENGSAQTLRWGTGDGAPLGIRQ